MKTLSCKTQNGFTLVEMVVVAGMIGFVVAAMYSLYTFHKEAAYTSDETVEVQQNIRTALDSISRDIRIAGLLLPASTTPISLGSATNPSNPGSTATTLQLSTGCPSAIITRITTTPSSQSQTGTMQPNTFTVDNDNSWSSFNGGDYVRIIHPSTMTEPGGTDRVYQLASTPGTNQITLNTYSGGDPIGISFNTGDVVCKVASSTATAPPNLPPNTITYCIGPSANCGNNVSTCPTGSCLIRIDEFNNPNVVAQNMASNTASPPGLQFQYLLNTYPSPAETNAPSSTNVSTIRAVRVTVTGQTYNTVVFSTYQTPKTRQMETLVQMRNQ